MASLRFLAANVVGFLLYQYTVVFIGGFLAAFAIPGAYFAFFGREHLDVGLALMNLFTHSLPTLVLVGDEDGITPPALSQELAALIPGARMQIISAAGHLANLEQPGAFNAAIDEFLSITEPAA